jgi:hypothetical protein
MKGPGGRKTFDEAALLVDDNVRFMACKLTRCNLAIIDGIYPAQMTKSSVALPTDGAN